jgi:hypothetical protein
MVRLLVAYNGIENARCLSVSLAVRFGDDIPHIPIHSSIFGGWNGGRHNIVLVTRDS